ncbi:hypothetical protein M0805_003781 [Coniferiporia weirii]|nr:hypothetical protein M0805_003781 [Coniferiporia weirii]
MSRKQQQASGPRVPKRSPAHLRTQKDVTELDTAGTSETMKPEWPDENNLLHFTLQIKPDEGMYKGGVYRFNFDIPETYPHDPPKVKCIQKIYHPNIDLEGNVCLNILREDWKPVLNLTAVFVGLKYLFLEPNADDPLNKDAAEVLRQNREQFVYNVNSSMRGSTVSGVHYDDVRGTGAPAV